MSRRASGRVAALAVVAVTTVGCASTPSTPEPELRIGLVDTAVGATVLADDGCPTVSQPRSASVVDDTTHGTDVATLIARGMSARCDASLPTELVVYPVTVVDGRVAAASYAAAVRAALHDGVDVLHVGVVFDQPVPAVVEATRDATDRGLLVIAPAGNRPGLPAGWPARLEGVTAVGSTDRDGQPSDTSAYDEVDVWAYGVDVEMPRRSGLSVPVSGTSYAAANLTAAVAELSARMPLSHAAAAVVDEPTISGGTP